MIRTRLLAAVAAFPLVLAAAPALADETDPPGDIELTGNASLVTDYRFRGLSQSSGDIAVQGALTVSHASGFYAGVWASSIGFEVVGPAAVATYGSVEVDLNAGWSGEVSPGIVADLGLGFYAYPNGKVGKANFLETYGSLSTTLGPATAKVGVNYAWKQASLNFDGGGKDDNLYLYTDLGAGVPGTPVSVAAHLGWTKGALSPKFATGETADYAGGLDWSLGATWAITPNLSLGASYVGVQGRSIDGYSDDTVVGTLKLSF